MSAIEFQSDHFSLEELSSRVFAAIHKPGGGSFSNAGLIDLGDKVLVFDTFDNQLAAKDLQRASQEIIGRDPEFVIVSHWHGDHWGGSQVFSDFAQIISTVETRDYIVNRSAPQLKELLLDPAPMDVFIKEVEQMVTDESDPEQKAYLKSRLSSFGYRRKSLETREIVVPEQTFEREMEFIGSQRRAVLSCPGGGHTDSDSILYLPDDQIAFIADLGFFQAHPFMGTSRPEAWVSMLRDLEDSDYDIFVPGHGPVGSKEDLQLLERYILTLIDKVKMVINSGGAADLAAERPIVPPFDRWTEGLSRYPANMRYLYSLYS